jgi:MYXO-CTERM domain-containing protein
MAVVKAISCVVLGAATFLPSIALALPPGAYAWHDPNAPTVHKVTAGQGCNLQYGGGPVISNVEAVPVFWGSKVDSSVQSWATGYLANIVNSPYLDALSEYNTTGQPGGTNQKIARGTATKGYTITPSSTSLSNISNNTIGNELVKQVNAGHLPKPTYDSGGHTNTFYVVFFPPGATLTLQGTPSCQPGGFCAYHESATFAGGSDNLLAFTAIPDMSPGSGCDQGCQSCATQGDPNCGGSITNIIATSLSHELAEAVTDVTNNSAWVDPTQGCGEIGDICAGQQDTGTVPGTTPSIDAQFEWSNQNNKCEMSNPSIGPQGGGCTPSSCSGATPICDPTTKTCRGCTGDSDCSGSTPHCATGASDPQKGQCVACTTNAQCTQTTPVCGTADTCGPCKTDPDCSAYAGTTCNTTTGGCDMSSSSSGSSSGSGSGSSSGSSSSGSSSSGSSSSGSSSSGSSSSGSSSSGSSSSGSGSSGKGGHGDAGSGSSSGNGDNGFGDTGSSSGCAMGTGPASGTVAVAALLGLALLGRGRRKRG